MWRETGASGCDYEWRLSHSLANPVNACGPPERTSGCGDDRPWRRVQSGTATKLDWQGRVLVLLFQQILMLFSQQLLWVSEWSNGKNQKMRSQQILPGAHRGQVECPVTGRNCGLDRGDV